MRQGIYYSERVAGPIAVDTVATFSSRAFVKVAVWRMSSEEAPTLTV